MEEGFLVEFNHFGFKYNAQAEPTLYDISLKIRKGEKILIAGPSGCGKSTIGSCLNGLIPFSFKGETTGSLKIKGKETGDMSIFELSKIVGTVLQDSDAQFVGMTAAEDIAFALENDCIETPELHERTERVAKTVGVSERLTHAPGELSGGQKQRVSIGGIMVDNVELYLFDEPLANLDPATGKQAIELIDEIKNETGAAVVIIEHRLEDVLWRDVDRIILMQEGRIIADLDPDTLLSTDLLRQAGVREPLYVTALKYAGVGIRPEIMPHSINSLALAPEETEKVREWFEHTPEAEQKKAEWPILSVRGLEFEYPNGVKAADNISTEIGKGTLIAIAGRNGAGKSTFAKLICGFETPQNGTITLFGKAGESDLAKLSIKERADHIGYVMQNPNQMKEEIQAKVEKALKICGLYPFRNWPVSALSFGQKKRVTIASILVLDPEVLILDEPTAGQDFRHYTEIMEFLRQLNADGLTIIMITHDMHLMLEYATRSIVFCDGKIVGDDTGANILTDPELVEKASLKETSLFRLALMCGIETPRAFVQRFIDFDRAVRS